MFKLILLLVLCTFGWIGSLEATMNYGKIAEQIITSLRLQPGERVLIRYDPSYFAELVSPLRNGIRAAGGVDLGALEYVEQAGSLEKIPSDSRIRKIQTDTHSKAFSELLNSVDVYIWLPSSQNRDLYEAEFQALRGWLKKGGTRRQLHFHWHTGSVMADGLGGDHAPVLDDIYQEALQLSYEELAVKQDKAIQLLRSGAVRVTTPEGTNLNFTTGARPFNKQDGNASAERAQGARMLVDREIELPAGVIRVAPIEDSANGTIVIPVARFGEVTVKNLKLQILQGRITVVSGEENADVAEKALKEAGDAAMRFREFGLGMNPKLTIQKGSNVLPYYGYGSGVVRLSLGDNEELGGNIRGGFVRWFFFPNATVTVGSKVLVKDGKLID